MVGGHRKNTQVSLIIKKAIDLYLAKNFDIFGYCYVEAITISEDGRKATALIRFEKDDDREIAIDRAEVNKSIQQMVRLRYYPKIEFVKISNA